MTQQRGEPWATVVGESYNNAKAALIHNEQRLLRLIGFDLTAEQPHKYLLNYCRTLNCSAGVVRLAACLLNDALLYTELLLWCSAAELSAGALHFSSVLLDVKLPCRRGVAWQDVLGVSCTVVDQAASVLTQAVQTYSV